MFNPIKKIIGWNLNRKQADVERDMERFGYSDEILERQVAINEARHKHDIIDESKIVYDKYVQ